MNHERSFFCESVIPGLLSLSKVSNYLDFKWCEAKYKATKEIYLKDGDYDGGSTLAAKHIDALGTLKSNKNVEKVVVESSSGMVNEHTSHSIGDSLKILECNVAALKKELIHYENAALALFKSLGVYGVQIIKTQVTLSKMTVQDGSYWRNIELRSAQIPTTWGDRFLMLQYLELLCTLFVRKR
ncbi:unnamed protein product [Mucor hiemalis]